MIDRVFHCHISFLTAVRSCDCVWNFPTFPTWEPTCVRAATVLLGYVLPARLLLRLPVCPSVLLLSLLLLCCLSLLLHHQLRVSRSRVVAFITIADLSSLRICFCWGWASFLSVIYILEMNNVRNKPTFKKKLTKNLLKQHITHSISIHSLH